MCCNAKVSPACTFRGGDFLSEALLDICCLCLSLSLIIVVWPLWSSCRLRLLLYVWPSIYRFPSSDSQYLTEIGGNLKEKGGKENANDEGL
jgi:hypothetical protein